MKKLSWLFIIAMLMISVTPALAEDTLTYSQAPMLDALVESGELPPVEERLPDDPRTSATDFTEEQLDYAIGTYGGTLRTVTSVVNWDADLFVGLTENLLNMQARNSGTVEPNLVGDFKMSDDMTTFTFMLRKGLKWSNGVEVVMEDVRFTVEDYIFNETLTPQVANWMTVDGVPFEFTIIDDLTFELKFPAPYGAFTAYMSAAGFNGYNDWIKPAYYLKPFHIDYAVECHGSLEAYYEFIAPFGEIIGYDDVTAEDVWMYVFNAIDVTTWEATDPIDCLTTKVYEGLVEEDFPMLAPWIMTSEVGGVMTFTRNPYYHKVDPEGNQLPYIDYLQSTLVEDPEMTQMKVMTGEVDFLRESATIDNISLYRENAEAASINPVICQQGNTPTDLYLNLNYGLNVDGTVKDDEASRAWQEVIGDIRFRQALAMSIDGAEILDAIYNGLGDVRASALTTGDVEGAKELLDEMGMLDTNGDGYRETPSGLPFQFQIWNANEATDIIPASELYVEYFAEIGINASIYTTDSTLLSTSVAANEVPARCIWAAFAITWHASGSFGSDIWAPLWNDWYGAGCPDEGEYLIPEGEVYELFKSIYTLMTHTPEEVTGEIRPDILETIDKSVYIIRPIDWVGGVVVVNEDIANIAQDVVTHSVNYFLEDMYFDR